MVRVRAMRIVWVGGAVLVCLVAAGWARSHFRRDLVSYDLQGTGYVMVESNLGGIYVAVNRDSRFGHMAGRIRAATEASWPWERGMGVPSRRWQGVQTFSCTSRYERGVTRVVIVSYWLVAALAAVPVYCGLRGEARRRRRGGGAGFPMGTAPRDENCEQR